MANRLNRTRSDPPTPELVSKWVRLIVEDGLTYSDVARRYGISSSTISRYVAPRVGGVRERKPKAKVG